MEKAATGPSISRTDAAHFVLMLAALGLSYVLPFELVLLSYVFLGPAHYLTEISWLHDRQYFLPHRGIALALVVVALAVSFVENATWFGIVVWVALIVCAILAGARTALQAILTVPPSPSTAHGSQACCRSFTRIITSTGSSKPR
jgi:hypothetical protein